MDFQALDLSPDVSNHFRRQFIFRHNFFVELLLVKDQNLHQVFPFNVHFILQIKDKGDHIFVIYNELNVYKKMGRSGPSIT
jgi:hypothetical protein